MFTLRMHGQIIIFILLFLAGIATANILFIYFALVVLFFVVLAMLLDRPSGITVKADSTRKVVWDDDTVTYGSTVTVASGSGIVAVADTLPEYFKIAEGNNFHVYYKGLKPLEVTYSYTVVCARRGSYTVGFGRTEAIQASGLEQTEVVDVADKAELIVRPKPSALYRIRDPRVTSQVPMPLNAKSRIGVATTDFREIRTYSRGDSFRSINWKATAKLSDTPGTLPLVNDREKEGRKTVWIFLDTREWMRAGSTVENAFEYAVQAALGVSQFYLARNCSVGLSFFNNDQPILPDTGKRQAFKIARRLIDVEITGTAGKQVTLAEAVESSRSHFAGTSPYFIVITMIEPGKASGIADGIKSMRRFSENSRTTPQIMVLQILGYGLSQGDECDRASVALMDLRNASVLNSIRRAGAFVVPWNPQSTSLLKVMTLGMKRKMRGA